LTGETGEEREGARYDSTEDKEGSPMKHLRLEVVNKKGSRHLEFAVKKMVNAGYVGRDRAAVDAHIEELRRAGVAPPPSVPMLFPVLSHNITTSGPVEVVSGKTSGEVEYVLLMDGSRVLVGVGSDHTDRELESYSIVQSKQVCRNVLSSTVWEYEEVEAGWDELLLQSWVRPNGADEEVLYQRAPLATILSAEKIMSLVESKLVGSTKDGLVIFSGTVPILTGEVICGDYFRCELRNPKTGGFLRCEYGVRVLNFLRD
jgi:hypothetical protein